MPAESVRLLKSEDDLVWFLTELGILNFLVKVWNLRAAGRSLSADGGDSTCCGRCYLKFMDSVLDSHA